MIYRLLIVVIFRWSNVQWKAYIYMRLKCRLNCPLNIYSCIHTFFCFFFFIVILRSAAFLLRSSHVYSLKYNRVCIWTRGSFSSSFTLILFAHTIFRVTFICEGTTTFLLLFQNWHYTIVSSQWTWPTPNWRKRKRERKSETIIFLVIIQVNTTNERRRVITI